MALTHQQCRSCGGDIRIDTAVSAPEQICTLCGQPCSEPEPPDDGERKPAPLSEERIAELRASGHKPQEMSIMQCPHCRAVTPVVAGLSLFKQRCTNCGVSIEEKPRKSRRRKRSRFTPDGVLVGRVRERVWMPMLGVLLVVVMAVIFGLWMKTRPDPGHAELEEPPPPLPRENVKELAAKFMAAATPEELLPLIRNPAAFEKPLRDWCAARPGALPLGGEFLGLTAPRQALGTRLMNATILFKGIPRLNVLTVETPDGWRVEWAAFTGIADIGVEDFLKTRPDAPATVLLNVRRSDYYNNTYSDSSKWLSLRVSDRLDEHPFYVYAARQDTALMRALEVLPPGDAPARNPVATFNSSRRMALRLHFVQPAAEGAPQAEVASVAGDGWYVP